MGSLTAEASGGYSKGRLTSPVTWPSLGERTSHSGTGRTERLKQETDTDLSLVVFEGGDSCSRSTDDIQNRWLTEIEMISLSGF